MDEDERPSMLMIFFHRYGYITTTPKPHWGNVDVLGRFAEFKVPTVRSRMPHMMDERKELVATFLMASRPSIPT